MSPSATQPGAVKANQVGENPVENPISTNAIVGSPMDYPID